MRTRRVTRVVCLCALAILFGAAISRAAPPVIMKVLVLAGSSSEANYQSITTYLQEIGVPYQAVVLNTITPDSSGNRLSKVPLSDSSTGRGLYQGVILTDSTFAACNPSCLSAADWTTLNTYASQFSVRVASYYTYPAAQWGLLPADSGASYTAAGPLNLTLTTAGAAVFPLPEFCQFCSRGGPGNVRYSGVSRNGHGRRKRDHHATPDCGLVHGRCDPHYGGRPRNPRAHNG